MLGTPSRSGLPRAIQVSRHKSRHVNLTGNDSLKCGYRRESEPFEEVARDANALSLLTRHSLEDWLR
jgi:hypothetical protein